MMEAKVEKKSVESRGNDLEERVLGGVSQCRLTFQTDGQVGYRS